MVIELARLDASTEQPLLCNHGSPGTIRRYLAYTNCGIPCSCSFSGGPLPYFDLTYIYVQCAVFVSIIIHFQRAVFVLFILHCHRAVFVLIILDFHRTVFVLIVLQFVARISFSYLSYPSRGSRSQSPSTGQYGVAHSKQERMKAEGGNAPVYRLSDN